MLLDKEIGAIPRIRCSPQVAPTWGGAPVLLQHRKTLYFYYIRLRLNGSIGRQDTHFLGFGELPDDLRAGPDYPSTLYRGRFAAGRFVVWSVTPWPKPYYRQKGLPKGNLVQNHSTH